MLGVTIFPTFYALILSFFRWEYILPGRPFVGLSNYIGIFRDTRYWAAIGHTLLIVAGAVSLEFTLGFLLANTLVEEIRGKRYFITALVLPVMVLPIVCGYTWRLLLDAQYGPINQIIGFLMGKPYFHFPWLSFTRTAYLSIIITDVWEWTPFTFLVLLAGLTSLPVDVYEASVIDGTSSWQQFRYLTLPLLKPIIIVVLLFRGLECFKMFDILFALTRGGPGKTTETISLYIYRIGFQYFRMGYTAAGAVILLLIVFGVVALALVRVVEK